MQEDSFYYGYYYEVWNDGIKEWMPVRKEYTGHFDTTLFVIREAYIADFIDGAWIKYDGARVLREYDEEGLVTSQIYQDCNLQTGEYETFQKNEYLYNEENVPVEIYAYNYYGDEYMEIDR
jgi:hypothetical protein